MRKMLPWPTALPPDEFGPVVETWQDDLLPIRLYCHDGWFAVQYGQQLDYCLEYEDAASRLGEALMHRLNTEGRLSV